MNLTCQDIQYLADTSHDRISFWVSFLQKIQARQMVEIGVYKGHFAAQILANCASLERYYLLDPWRHLDAWNKPSNQSDTIFDEYLAEARARTDFAKDKCVILRGKTTEMIEEIQDGELDFAYIDGDHTLKGITIDLHRVYPKIKPGGWIGGDDFSQTIWQHATRYEPTLVFPYAVYFAEAVGAQIYALPYNQFLLKRAEPPAPNHAGGDQSAFEFIDLTKSYQDTGLKAQFNPDEILKRKLAESNPFGKLWRRIVKLNRRDQ